MSESNTSQISMMELFKVGAHRGNKKQKLNPKLKSYVYGSANGLSLIDLAKTQEVLSKIADLAFKLGKTRKQILFVGTEKHVQEVVKEAAGKTTPKQSPFVNQRWLGGTLTNWSTVKKTLKTLEKNQKIIENKEFFDTLSRNEQLSLTRETEKLNLIFGGLANLKSNRPGAVFILDGQNNYVAMNEAKTVNVPIISLISTATQTLPESLDYTVVSNNNSTKFVQIVADLVVESYNKGAAEAEPLPVRENRAGGFANRDNRSFRRDDRRPREGGFRGNRNFRNNQK